MGSRSVPNVSQFSFAIFKLIQVQDGTREYLHFTFHRVFQMRKTLLFFCEFPANSLEGILTANKGNIIVYCTLFLFFQEVYLAIWGPVRQYRRGRVVVHPWSAWLCAGGVTVHSRISASGKMRNYELCKGMEIGLHVRNLCCASDCIIKGINVFQLY